MFCSKCGHSLPDGGIVMFCSKCGHSLPDGAAFCTVCGTPVAQKVQPADATQPSAAPRPAAAPTKKHKRKLVVTILCAALAAILVLSGVLTAGKFLGFSGAPRGVRYGGMHFVMGRNVIMGLLELRFPNMHTQSNMMNLDRNVTLLLRRDGDAFSIAGVRLTGPKGSVRGLRVGMPAAMVRLRCPEIQPIYNEAGELQQYMAIYYKGRVYDNMAFHEKMTAAIANGDEALLESYDNAKYLYVAVVNGRVSGIMLSDWRMATRMQ